MSLALLLALVLVLMLVLGNATNFGTSVHSSAITGTYNGISIAVLWRCECIVYKKAYEYNLLCL